MDYPSTFGLDVRILHDSRPANDIERVIGRKADRSNSKGMPRITPSGVERMSHRTGCTYDFGVVEDIDATKRVRQGLDFITPFCTELRELGVYISLTLKIFDPDFIQVYLPLEVLEDLAANGISFNLENHVPS